MATTDKEKPRTRVPAGSSPRPRVRVPAGSSPVEAKPKTSAPPMNARAVNPSPAIETGSRALTAPGGAAPPPRPPTGTSVMSPGAAAGPPSAGASAGRALATRPIELGRVPAMARGAAAAGRAGPIAALVGAGAGALAENVQREYPRVLREEQANGDAEGISTRAFDAPARVSGRVPQLVGRRIDESRSDQVPARDPMPMENAAELGPRGTAPRGAPETSLPPTVVRGTARPPTGSPRQMARDERDNSADSLNRIELARIRRVNAGMEEDRKPQFAKGGFVAGKKGVNPFATSAAMPKAPKAAIPAFAKGKGAAMPATTMAPPSAKKPKMPKPKGLPFAKGGLVPKKGR